MLTAETPSFLGRIPSALVEVYGRDMGEVVIGVANVPSHLGHNVSLCVGDGP